MIEKILTELKKNSDENDRKGSENYLKGKVKFIGVKGPKIQKIFSKLWNESLKKLQLNKQIELSLNLLKSEYFESKRFAIELLSKIQKNLDAKILDDFYIMFDNEINDWATCDVLSSKAIKHLVKRDDAAKQAVIKWKDSKKKWAKRSSAVSFVNIAKTGNYNNEIISICSSIIKDNDRFVQLGAGWVLRELSTADLDLAISFIKKNYKYFSREALRYATEKMSPILKKKVLENNF